MAKYISYEELQKWIIREGCDDGCGYIDERDIVNMDWQEWAGCPCVNYEAESEDNR